MILFFRLHRNLVQIASIAVVAWVGSSACSNRAVPSDWGTDGVALGGDAFGADASSFCSGPTKLALNNQPVSVSSIGVAVTEYWDPMIPGSGRSTFKIKYDLPLSSGEEGVLDVLYNGIDLYDGKGTLRIVGYVGSYPLASLFKCQSTACSSRQLLEELKAFDLKSLTGWFISDSAKRRLSLCLSAEAQSSLAHPSLRTLMLYLNAIEATFKKETGG